MSKTSNQGDHNTFGIGAVARLTGLSVHALRVWERRHGAVKVRRSESGRRLYTAADVERLTLLKRLVDRGETISQVAVLTEQQLHARLDNFERQSTQRIDEQNGQCRIAIFGEFPGVDFADAFDDMEIVARDSRLERFRADAAKAQPDVLLIEQPMVTSESRRLVSQLRRECAADRVIIVIGLGRREDVRLLGDTAEIVMRAPVSADEIVREIVRPGMPVRKTHPGRRLATDSDGSHTEVPPRRYTRTQLGRLGAVQSTVECECPYHLVELVDRLSVFEEYSAHCENRNKEDAALHAFLHRTTAQARALIEIALDRVVQAEGLDPGPG